MAAKKKPTKTSPAKKPSSARKPAKKSTKSSKPAPKKASARSAPARKPTRGGKTAAPRKPQRKAKRPSTRAKRPARPTRTSPAKPGVSAQANPQALLLARAIAAAAAEKKALDVVIIDTSMRGGSVGYDYVVLASGESDRQLDAIADAVDTAARAMGRRATSVEASPDWVLSNFDDVVAHFFTPDKRSAYDLEGLWNDAPRLSLT